MLEAGLGWAMRLEVRGRVLEAVLAGVWLEPLAGWGT